MYAAAAMLAHPAATANRAPPVDALDLAEELANLFPQLKLEERIVERKENMMMKLGNRTENSKNMFFPKNHRFIHC